MRILFLFLIVSGLFYNSYGGRYESSWNLDLPLFIGGATLWGTGSWRLQQMPPTESSHKVTLLVWDEPFKGTYGETSAKLSDLMLVGGMLPFYLSASALYSNQISTQEYYTDMLMLSEVLMINAGLNLWTRSFRVWPRPLVWSSEAPESKRNAGDASGSFYSGHASGAFAVATFTSVLYHKRNPESPVVVWMYLGTHTAAATIAGLRVAAGRHFLTDVVVGAAMGSLLGWAIPRLHESNQGETTGISWYILPQQIGMQYRF
jgi:membrane-associated phospholipid phosphatase